jgi:formyl-CoA transferase
MQEAVINFSRIAFARQALWGKAAPRVGNQSLLGATAPSELFPTKGGGPSDYCFIYTSRSPLNHQWNKLLSVIGREDLIGDPRFETPEERFKNRETVDEIIARWAIKHDKHAVMKILGEAGVPAGAVFDTLELSEDPFLNQREAFVTVRHPVRGDVKMPGWPVKMSESHVKTTASPLLGADNAAVYGSLGLNHEEIKALRAEKAI